MSGSSPVDDLAVFNGKVHDAGQFLADEGRVAGPGGKFGGDNPLLVRVEDREVGRRADFDTACGQVVEVFRFA